MRKISYRVQELINRKPSKWGKVTVKTFEQDITIFKETIISQQAVLDEIKKVSQEYKNRYVGETADSFLVDKILDTLKKKERTKEKGGKN